MIDWLPWLIPLLVLAVLLLFGFVGCTLNSEGVATELPLNLQYPANLDTTVQSIAVEYTFELFETELFHETKVGNGAASATLNNDSIDPGGGFLAAVAAMKLDQRAEITCNVVVTTSETPSDPGASGTPTALGPVEREKESDESPPLFFLTRTDGTFKLS
jgi:hypothetical protein